MTAWISQLSHTWDEGMHVTAGLQVLEEGRYSIQTEKPPLSRIVLALIPHWRGARPPSFERRSPGMPDIFYRTPDYSRNVTEARVPAGGSGVASHPPHHSRRPSLR